MIKLLSGVFLVMLLIAAKAQARVFDITKETFASYLTFNAGQGTLNKTPFENESGTSVTYDSEFGYNYGGEFGFLYATPFINLRFGMEIIKPISISNVTASNSTTSLYTLKSDVLGYVPKIGLEINLFRSVDSRYFFFSSYGSASLTIKNDYVLTTEGQSNFGLSDHTVDLKSSANTWSAGFGGEYTLTDTTTFMFEASYRSLIFSELNYSKAVTTFTGSKSIGDSVVDINGDKRTINFSGYLTLIGFRFYL